MKKQFGLIVLIAVLLSFMAFSGVASAQSNKVQAVMFTSPFCDTCQKVKPRFDDACAKYGITPIYYDVSDATSKGIAQANSVTATPTIVISGAVPARFEGDVSQAQIEAALKAAIGNPATPTPTPVPKQTVVQKAATPTPVPKVVQKVAAPTVKPTQVPTVKATATPTVTPTPTPTVTPTPTDNKQPTIDVTQPQVQTQTTTQSTGTQTVPEFSLLGLGAPALIIGAVYLVMRRK